MYKVFTYGTLMKGQRNHHYLKDEDYVCDGILDDYGLKETGENYPAAIPMKNYRVYGEIYEVDDTCKKHMDELEEVGYLYDCNLVNVHTDKGDMDVFFYEYICDTSDMKTRIPYGKWNENPLDVDDDMNNEEIRKVMDSINAK